MERAIDRIDERFRTLPDFYTKREDHNALRSRVESVEKDVEECHDTGRKTDELIKSESLKQIDYFERRVAPTLELHNKLITVTTQKEELEQQIMLLKVEQITGRPMPAPTPTVQQLPPTMSDLFWMLIDRIGKLGTVFLIVVAIATVLITWWAWSVHNAK